MRISKRARIPLRASATEIAHLRSSPRRFFNHSAQRTRPTTAASRSILTAAHDARSHGSVGIRARDSWGRGTGNWWRLRSVEERAFGWLAGGGSVDGGEDGWGVVSQALWGGRRAGWFGEGRRDAWGVFAGGFAAGAGDGEAAFAFAAGDGDLLGFAVGGVAFGGAAWRGALALTRHHYLHGLAFACGRVGGELSGVGAGGGCLA